MQANPASYLIHGIPSYTVHIGQHHLVGWCSIPSGLLPYLVFPPPANGS